VFFRTRHWPPRRKLLDYRDADALFFCQRLISQALPIHFIPAHAKTKQISLLFFALLRPAHFLCTLPAVGGLPRFFRTSQSCHKFALRGKWEFGRWRLVTAGL
jgi:hypothetical protein